MRGASQISKPSNASAGADVIKSWSLRRKRLDWVARSRERNIICKEMRKWEILIFTEYCREVHSVWSDKSQIHKIKRKIHTGLFKNNVPISCRNISVIKSSMGFKQNVNYSILYIMKCYLIYYKCPIWSTWETHTRSGRNNSSSNVLFSICASRQAFRLDLVRASHDDHIEHL